MSTLHERVEASKRDVFLRRVWEVAGGRPGVDVPSGALGHELGLPYEDALRIVEELTDEGLVRREEALEPPDGPMIRLTRRGRAEAKPKQAA